jgi:hypothetical protein
MMRSAFRQMAIASPQIGAGGVSAPPALNAHPTSRTITDRVSGEGGHAKASHREPDHGGDAKIIDINRVASDRAAAAEKAATKKSFTSEKLTWINLLMMDHRQQPVARLVGIAIAQTINEDTKVSKTSDRVIADRLGISVRTVNTSRQALRDGEWLTWHKPDPRAANRTKLVLTEKNIRSVEDHQIALKDQRDYKAAEGRRRWPKS